MTTIVADRVEATILDPALERHSYFSWGAAIAGALAASLVTFMLLALGAGLGLMLAGPVNNPAPLKTILTAGGIYFFAVEAFGFAVGGYIAGRLCGPVLQSRDEEMFRSGAHGLVVWALSAGACLLFLAVGAAVAANTTANVASAFGMSAAQKGTSGEPTSATVSYWTDVLFRAPGAGAVTTTTTTQPAPAATPAPVAAPPATEATPAPAPAPSETTSPAENAAPTENGGNTNESTTSDQSNDDDGNSNGDNDNKDNGDESQPSSPSPAVYVPQGALRARLIPIQYSTTTTTDESGGATTTIADVDPDVRAQVSRILMANAAKPNEMRADDRQFIEQAIVTQNGVSQADARQRLDALLARINDQETKAAETARKAAAYMNIWLGLSLLFGLLVATGSAVVARMEEEKKGEEAGSARIPPRVTPPAAV